MDGSVGDIFRIHRDLEKVVREGKEAVIYTRLEYCLQNSCELSIKLRTVTLSGCNDPLVQAALNSGKIKVGKQAGEIVICEPYYPEPHLVILGGGHIAQPLCEFGSQLGFKVTVFDDRPAFADKTRFLDADKVICGDFHRCLDLVVVDKYSFTVIATRGHKHDLVCLHQALGRDMAYLGMVGSHRRVKSIKEQLCVEGYRNDQLNRLHAPIGLSIGAVTPGEIAISILAEIISVKRSGTPYWPEYDRLVIGELSKCANHRLNDLPGAMVTVIAARGSVPRGPGAKMLIWADGRVAGSIGGGCSEAEVIRIARDMAGTGHVRILEIDLTNDPAVGEGMSCGGILEVLIEGIGTVDDGSRAECSEERVLE